MKGFIVDDEWSVVEEAFSPERQMAAESLFSLGNGHMGQRANFEERYSGETLQGSYVAGIYYPDKTRVGWWKNGYPEYFAKVLNSPNWIGIDVSANGEPLDLATCACESFRRVLSMQHGVLTRDFTVRMAGGARLRVSALRFLSMAMPDIGAVDYAVTALDDLELTLAPYLDGDVRNQDSNYDEKFWNICECDVTEHGGFLLAQTKKLDFRVGFAMACECTVEGRPPEVPPRLERGAARVGTQYRLTLKAGQTARIRKLVAVITSLDYDTSELKAQAQARLAAAQAHGFDALLQDHKARWAEIWNHSDIVIDGDVEAQQGIRFNIFHLNQTYTGDDERLNIGPKGFTGEKYGGSTYWDTEAYCIPFFVSTAPSKVTRNLLVYRYKHLAKAIENAGKLGFTGGAALYPMVTMNGEECHNEWEITFEEIHRNGAIAHAIFDYIRHTGDRHYLAECGLEVLIGIARFWAQRVTFSEAKGKYVILGVTGPNEYENNVNNNWYTNRIACWCLDYAAEAAETVRKNWPDRYGEIVAVTGLDATAELSHWADISTRMYFPFDETHGIFLQQDGWLDKEPILAADLPPAERPINKHWSWDRILRSPFIKQADVLQGIYMFEESFDTDTIKRHFDHYEARTVHESSLSPCIHAILAARIGNVEKAYELYLRTSRLDLDDYNREVKEGLHITSMAGTWMAIVEGFGGKRMKDGKIYLSPLIHEKWRKYAFRLLVHDTPLQVTVTKDDVRIAWQGAESIVVNLYGEDRTVEPAKVFVLSREPARKSGLLSWWRS